jgi:hypothetical protein
MPGSSKTVDEDLLDLTPDADMEKRQSPRYRLEAPAILRVQGRPGPFLVTLLDVSSSGLRLSSPSAFPDGSRVTIKCLGAEITGEIRYARPVEGEASTFNVGVLADAISGGVELDLVRLLRKS